MQQRNRTLSHLVRVSAHSSQHIAAAGQGFDVLVGECVGRQGRRGRGGGGRGEERGVGEGWGGWSSALPHVAPLLRGGWGTCGEV